MYYLLEEIATTMKLRMLKYRALFNTIFRAIYYTFFHFDFKMNERDNTKKQNTTINKMKDSSLRFH